MNDVTNGGAAREVVLELRNVSHSFRARAENFAHAEHRVLHEVSFALHRGEVLGIVGRNGAGKSTMLRLMAGILAPRAGTVARAADTSCALLSLGLGFQPQLSGRDNARLAALLQGADRAEAEAALDGICDFAELGAAFDEPVKTYSTGMRARLGFAAALINRVDILLIDEVLSVGDTPFRMKAQRAMLQKIAGNQTVVLVSHSEPQVRKVCDRAILLEDGHVACDGSADEVFARYAGQAATAAGA